MTKTQLPDDFSYGVSMHDASNPKFSVSIFADRVHVRDQLREDAAAAGFRIAAATRLAALCDDEARPLGDVVLLDIPEVDASSLAALARLDLRAARAGAALAVSTSVDALDDVFGCLDQSSPQILVDPSRAERLIALGQLLVRLPGGRVRELSKRDRMVLLRLTEQVSQLAERIEGWSSSGSAGSLNDLGHSSFNQGGSTDRDDSGGVPARLPTPASLQTGQNSAFHFSPSAGTSPLLDDGLDRLIRVNRPPLPDPQLVRRVIRQRQHRARFFEPDLFADPAWDMLLDLTAAQAEHARVSVTSLCIASGVPPTTALRWIGQMTDAGLLQRNEDETDRRRAFITLTDKAVDAISGYFSYLGDALGIV